jgi:acyl carrier protein
MPTTFDRLQDILIEKFSVARETILPESRLDTLGLDSLDLIEAMFEIEEAFGIRIPQDTSEVKTATVRDLVETIERLQPKAEQ